MVETVSRQGLSQGVFPCYMCPWEPHDLMGTRWICYGHMGATGSHWHRLSTGSHGLSSNGTPVTAWGQGPHGVPWRPHGNLQWYPMGAPIAQKDFGRIGQARLGKCATWIRRGELVGLI